MKTRTMWFDDPEQAMFASFASSDNRELAFSTEPMPARGAWELCEMAFGYRGVIERRRGGWVIRRLTANTKREQQRLIQRKVKPVCVLLGGGTRGGRLVISA